MANGNISAEEFDQQVQRELLAETQRLGRELTQDEIYEMTTGAVTRFLGSWSRLAQLGFDKENTLVGQVKRGKEAGYQNLIQEAGLKFDEYGRMQEREQDAQAREDYMYRYFMDPRRAFQRDPETGEITAGEGPEGDLYNLMLQSQQEQYAEQKRVADRAEQDLFRGIQADRRSTMEDIRNRRRGQLRSGLTQSQIANQEISSMLASQQLANQNRRMFQDQRGQMDIYNTGAQQQARAAQDLFGLAGGFNQAAAGQYAASTADPTQQAFNIGQYGQGNQGFNEWWKQGVGQQNQ